MRARLTRMEKDIVKKEEKEELTLTDGRRFTCMKELDKQFDQEFEERHVEVLNFIAAEETAVLESEQAGFNKHVDRVTNFIKRLGQLRTWYGW